MKGTAMGTVIRGGTVVTADLSYKADVLVKDGKIALKDSYLKAD